MADAKARASGPLWAAVGMSGKILPNSLMEVEVDPLDVPVRLLPGHGRYVPAELVAAIEKAAEEFDRVTPFVNQGVADAWEQFMAAIRAAKEGEV